MLKKMRRCVILAAILAFFAVIMLIAALVNIFNYAVVTGRTDETLQAILMFESNIPANPDPNNPPPPRPFQGLPDMESNYMTRFFTVHFDRNGEVIFASTDNIASIGEEDAVKYAREVLQSGKERGYRKAYRFVKAQLDDTTIVIFLNTAREQQSMLSLLILTPGMTTSSQLCRKQFQ